MKEMTGTRRQGRAANPSQPTLREVTADNKDSVNEGLQQSSGDTLFIRSSSGHHWVQGHVETYSVKFRNHASEDPGLSFRTLLQLDLSLGRKK